MKNISDLVKANKKLIIKEKDVTTLKKSYKKIYKKLNLFDVKKTYEKYFREIIFSRGYDLINLKKLTKVTIKNNIIKSKVIGKNDIYDTKVELDNDRIINASCTCKYFIDKKDYCKHIASLVIYIKGKDNIKPMVDMYKLYKEELLKMNNNVIDYISHHESYYGDFELHNTLNVSDSINKFITNSEKIVTTNIETYNEHNMYYTLREMIKMFYYFKNELEKHLLSYKEILIEKYKQKRTNINNKSNVGTILGVLVGLGEYALKEEKPINNSGYTDKELDEWGLDEIEKEEIYGGDFEPWDYEDDETWEKADKYDIHD